MTYDALSHLSDPTIWLIAASAFFAAGVLTAFALAWVVLWREGRKVRGFRVCSGCFAARQSDAEGEG